LYFVLNQKSLLQKMTRLKLISFEAGHFYFMRLTISPGYFFLTGAGAGAGFAGAGFAGAGFA
jgi:hypothetical protein